MAIKTNKKKLLLKDDIHNKTAPAAIFATTGPANFKFQNLQLRNIHITVEILIFEIIKLLFAGCNKPPYHGLLVPIIESGN